MADSNPFNPEDWMEAQRKYWSAWMDMSRKSMGGSEGTTNWGNGLDQWWKTASTGMPLSGNDALEQMMNVGRGYFSMAENLYRGNNGQQNAAEAVNKWLDQMSNAFQGFTNMPGASKDAKAFWQMPLDTWSRATSSFMPMPGDFMQALRPPARAPYGDAVQEQLDRFLSVPGVGYTRESQEQYQNLAKLMVNYQQAMQNYQGAFNKVGMDSIDRFRARLDDAGRQDKPITSMRTLYDEWVDVCEEVYGEFVMSEEYAKIYGEMVNSLMAVKRQGTRLMDEVTESLNMPTRREVNTLHRRLQESRREMQALKTAVRKLTEQANGDATPAQAEAKAESKGVAESGESAATGTRGRSTATKRQTASTKAKQSD
ncbi:class III poly(R)-hydroxyalkanoic acid synthase subunit PhaE [Ectothiorhodospira lacustris]|uniref:class III poly(R)-hydroxyalkanoic acid synthase subunit PhaE n=1 Tax=Ectothiorhodospira lacustris TaxID=2899127 RepID=UPI001EE8547B|nr:class III poly(R)-hydroxyalkanoic acid synthase subunit PhaE [Ectothiorhodospira lacustris]MCG5511311.1 class III poly(R)-hydroxyalkanoic acid synthase subunit PhaE [Ectothiorhodospira lacustris]MCG5523039.1 class III poly(R)-hydroxyalkanoic acid synthase subunit PhaE [Ectothiorhodospira lacustris]